MNGVTEGNNVLIVFQSSEDEIKEVKANLNKTNPNVTSISSTGFKDSTKSDYDVVILSREVDLETVATKALSSLKLDGKCVTHCGSDTSDVELILKTTGFVGVTIDKREGGVEVVSSKPKYQIGSSAKLNLKKPATVWKLDDDEGEEDTIDPDNLLDEDDLKKPTAESLRVCGTTGKRKACKDCSCGLAEELEAETGKTVVDTSKGPKSSCGSCYLGDAFRCASCPYLGMPAFKPGEKVQLQLKDDL